MAAFAHSVPCWVDVQLSDLEAGKRFYGGLFGWTFRAGDGLPFADAFNDGRLVAALAAKRDGRMPTAWGVYFSTDDITATVALIREAGGQVITDPVRAGRAGVLAQAADPGGAVFGLWQAGDRAGFEKQNEPGAFCWTEVYTRRPEAVDAFYEQVFGFKPTDLGESAEGGTGTAESGIDYRMWSPAGTEPGPDTAIGGRSVITDAFPAEMPSYFLTYFAVADCDRAAETVVHLGGRVTAPPFDIPYGRMAVVQDDQGAAFAVLQPTELLP
ncbi:VOC family protein [Streptomyces sp. NPDC057136]|uniref:VOC family protein n=1 Tax=Streptomyces sp. NPDC057136 TaxID=3346029 RepID=UPI0036302660